MMNFEETLKALPLFQKTKLVPLLWGHTGIGKTELVEQFAALNDMDLIVIHVAQLEPSDFVGLYQTTEDGRTRNCPPNWLPYKTADGKKGRKLEVKGEGSKESLAKTLSFLANEGAGEINPNGGIVFLDEFNRGHEDIRQAMYQFLNSKKIHTYSLPNNYHIVTAANPSDGYEVYELDPALINRLAHIRFKPEIKETLVHLDGKFGINPVTAWIRTDQAMLEYGDDDFKINGLKYSPRITEAHIQLWSAVQTERKEFQRKILETIMIPEKVQSFLAFQDELKHCSWADVLNGTKKEKIAELVANKRLDVLSTLTNYLGDTLKNYELGSEIPEVKAGKEKEAIKNLAEFLKVLPPDMCASFFDWIPRKRWNHPKCITQDKDLRDTLRDKLAKFAHLYE